MPVPLASSREGPRTSLLTPLRVYLRFYCHLFLSEFLLSFQPTTVDSAYPFPAKTPESWDRTFGSFVLFTFVPKLLLSNCGVVLSGAFLLFSRFCHRHFRLLPLRAGRPAVVLPSFNSYRAFYPVTFLASVSVGYALYIFFRASVVAYTICDVSSVLVVAYTASLLDPPSPRVPVFFARVGFPCALYSFDSCSIF